MQDNGVVYRSQAERAVDLWLWNGGGWQCVLVALAAVALSVALLKLGAYLRRR